MNKEEKYTTQPYNPSIIKGDVYISSGTQNMETLTRWQDPTIEKLQQKNKELQAKVNQLETNRDEAIEYIENIWYSKNTTNINDIGYTTNKFLKIKQLLERGKE